MRGTTKLHTTRMPSRGRRARLWKPLRVSILGAGVLTLACATGPTPEQEARWAEQRRQAATIDITSNPDVVKPCRRLGAVDGAKYAELAQAVQQQQGETYNRTATFLRTDAYDMGGDTLLLSPDGLRGDVYLCGAPR